MIHDFFEKFLKQLRLFHSDGVKLLSDGRARDFEDYKYVCGKLRGLEAAESIISNLMDEWLSGRKLLDKQISEVEKAEELSW